jgi:hypothetical protein
MLIDLTVFFYPDDYDPEEDILGKEPKMRKDVLTVNTDHIVAIHNNDKGNCMIRLTNGDVFESTIKIESLREVLEVESSKDFLIVGDN